jgi:hypothetical protein
MFFVLELKKITRGILSKKKKIVIPAILRVADWVARYKCWARMRLLFILKAIVV